MKKTLFLMCFMLIPSLAFANSDSNVVQEKNYPTLEEIKQMNIALDKMINEANKKLEVGETEIFLEEKIGETNETVSLSFKSEDVLSNESMINRNSLAKTFSVSSTPSGKKRYYAAVENTAGWNFKHQLAGDFTYSGGKINGATKDVNMTGAMYSESHTTWIDQLDSSVWDVRSHGKFKALKYLVEYNTYLTVKLLGSGDYRIERASIGF